MPECLVGFCLIMLAGIGVWFMAKQIRQEQLNHALIAAIVRDDTQSVSVLLAQGADANTRESADTSFAFWKAFLRRLRGQKDVLNPAAPALLIAIEHQCNAAIVEALLDRGADPNGRDKEGCPAVWLAVDSPVLDVMPLLLRYGVDTNQTQPGSEGRTLLMYAAGWGEDTEIDQLMQARVRASINARNEDGGTALIYAVDHCRPENVRALLKWHADVHIKEADGKTALALAKEGLKSRMTTSFNHEVEEESWQEIVHLLKQASTKE